MVFQITSSDNLYARSNSKTTVRFLLLLEPDNSCLPLVSFFNLLVSVSVIVSVVVSCTHC